MSSSLRPLPAAMLFTALGILSIGCKQRAEATPPTTLTPVPMSVKDEIPSPPPAAPRAENAIDTSPNALDTPSAPLSSKTILPPPVQRQTFPKVRTPSDERLPSWVPVTGRLTVVSSHDLAKNLGLPQPPADAASAGAATPSPEEPSRAAPRFANPNEGGFVVRPAAPARASKSMQPSRGRRGKHR